MELTQLFEIKNSEAFRDLLSVQQETAFYEIDNKADVWKNTLTVFLKCDTLSTKGLAHIERFSRFLHSLPGPIVCISLRSVKNQFEIFIF